MKAYIQPSIISGLQQAPPSKSDMQRACAAALIRKGISIIHNPGSCNDDLAAIEVIQQLGATVQYTEETLVIESKGVHAKSNQLHCGESGLGIRMFTPVAALNASPITITGEGSLQTRPMDFFNEILPQLGVEVLLENGRLPLHITGPLKPATIDIDGSLSSQFLTGLLMAYAAANATNVSINVHELKSRPYIDLTLQVMQAFHLKLPVNNAYNSFSFGTASPNEKREVNYTIDGDWSGAAFLLVAGAIAGNIEVSGLKTNSAQGDKKIMEALKDAGAEISFDNNNIIIKKKKLEAFIFDANDCPDLFPPLVALAAVCNGTTIIKGLKRLKHKESDRGITLQQEFAKLGITITLNDDEMTVEGKEKITVGNNILHSHHDHRIAMACAVAGLVSDKPVTIECAEAINKSYPTFFKHIASLGAAVEME